MEFPRYGTIAQCTVTSVGLILLSGCLTRMIAANFAPVYGSVAASETRKSLANLASYPQLFLLHNDLIKPLFIHKFKLLCQVVIWWIVLLWSIERLILFPLSRFLSVDWAIGTLVVPTKILLFLLIIKLVLDISPTAFRQRILSRDTGWKDVATFTTLGVTVNLLISDADVRAGTLLEWLASTRPALYIFLTHSTGVITRENLQIYAAFVVMAIFHKMVNSRRFLGYCSIASVLSAAIFMQPKVNPQLMYEGYEILQRAESTTGYVSVLENDKSGLRILRQDHSILGGSWLLTPKRKLDGIDYIESIFSAFYTLEAVRLIVPDASAARWGTDLDAISEEANDSAYRQHGVTNNALVVGLGIGTAPSALQQHRVQTTVVEIDPLVIRFARQYFTIHPDLDIVNQDAQEYVGQACAHHDRYDYIIHDVFTGGAEPIALFSYAFLNMLKCLLKPSGAIAINYAGNLRSQFTHAVLDRIISTFNNCRIFRDNIPEAAKGGDSDSDTFDFANIIAFCSGRPWHFRNPVVEDYLRSAGRRDTLIPKYEITDSVLARRDNGSRPQVNWSPSRDEHVADAQHHWKIMRDVLPHGVWEAW